MFYSGNQLQLLKPQELVDANDNIVTVAPPATWRSVIEIYGTLVTGSTEIRLALPSDSELIGTIAYHPTDPYILLFEPIEDTLPSNTLNPVSAIINPQNVKVDSTLLSPTAVLLQNTWAGTIINELFEAETALQTLLRPFMAAKSPST